MSAESGADTEGGIAVACKRLIVLLLPKDRAVMTASNKAVAVSFSMMLERFCG